MNPFWAFLYCFHLSSSSRNRIAGMGVPDGLHVDSHLESLESIQRRATRIILKQHRQQMPYPERLRLLNWVSLESHRKYLLINLVAQALYNIVKSSDISSKIKVIQRRQEDIRFHHLMARTKRLKPRSQMPLRTATNAVRTIFRQWKFGKTMEKTGRFLRNNRSYEPLWP